MTEGRSRTLPKSAGAVIIGGGVMGTSIAFHLAEAGVRDVVLLERHELASGSTSKAAGGVRAQFSDPLNIAMGARGLTAFEEFHQRTGQHIDLHQVGYLFLLTDAEQLSTFQRGVELQNSMGIDSVLLDAEETARLSPATVNHDVLGAAFHARDGYCSPESVTLGYAGAARRLGASVLTGVDVIGISHRGGEITAVQTSGGDIQTNLVVCAAGAWSSSVGAMVGVGLPVEPLRRQILVTEPLGEDLRRVLPESMPMTLDPATTFYMHREGPGLLFGMSYAAEQPGFRDGYSEEWLPDLMAAIERRCPALLEVGIAHRWSGFYEVTPDDNAIIGEAVEISRFLYATGFSGHGFLQAPAVGEIMRDLVLEREPVIDVDSLSADRFTGGQQRPEAYII